MEDLGARFGLGQATAYEIKVQGELDEDWVGWFDDGRRVWSTVLAVDGGITTLTSTVADQPALYGLLAKIRDLGLPLVSVIRVHTEEPRPHAHNSRWCYAGV
jgi:hypothetical protein